MQKNAHYISVSYILYTNSRTRANPFTNSKHIRNVPNRAKTQIHTKNKIHTKEYKYYFLWRTSYTRIHTSTCTHTYKHTHTHARACTHTHTYTHSQFITYILETRNMYNTPARTRTHTHRHTHTDTHYTCITHNTHIRVHWLFCLICVEKRIMS